MKMYKSKSFTLIEMVIAIGLLSITLTATAGVLISVVKSFQKQSALQRIEKNGDLALRTIEEKIRKSKAVYLQKTEVIQSGSPVQSFNYNMIKVVTETSSGTDKVEYLGIARRSVSGKFVNYLFVIPDNEPASFPDISDENKYKITNDSCSDGVDIILTPGVNPITVNSTSSPNWVSATIEIALASCNSSFRSTMLSKKFQTLVISRGSY